MTRYKYICETSQTTAKGRMQVLSSNKKNCQLEKWQLLKLLTIDKNSSKLEYIHYVVLSFFSNKENFYWYYLIQKLLSLQFQSINTFCKLLFFPGFQFT